LSLTTAFTGVLLAFYYEPTGGAYNSLKVIATEIPNGWLVQRLIILQAMGLLLSLVEIVVMFLGERFAG